MVPSLCHGALAAHAHAGWLSSWQCSGIWSHQDVQVWDETKDNQLSAMGRVWCRVRPSPGTAAAPGLALAEFSSSQAAETGFNCRVAPGHHFSVCKVSSGTLAQALVTGGKTSRRSSFARTVCTWVKGAAAKLRYKICVTFKIKCFYRLWDESRCWACIAQPGPGLIGPCVVPIHIHKTTETFSVV